ncbi:hypothetical protein DWB61_08435 [Ancylomarina euxinus]|uniref:Phospholipase n=1 Tax=Ancylomarina euxinus TaxID=2283627 RepID=A0A425Y1X9_9BACT|nr:hypothetical protein [Ancylomarina euxinus]MCZ4695188.1 hypothetical protein [Ancylomarina euxinus]MUP14878.1 hypothetical protein [Ancylomarina euxinus]RRG21773.1 hypothetical protein DWB61_08435 [Ancylomarina euxinus]
MNVLLLVLLAGAVLTLLLTYIGKLLFPKKNGGEETASEPLEECCGAHEVCETDLLNKMSEEIIYYEDEELDAYRNFEENDFNDDQIDEFREILYSLKEKEIEPWLKSLELRHIILPSIIKSEVVFMLVK